METNPRLDEHIRAQRNGLFLILILTTLAFITSLDRIKLADTIGRYDRHLIELYVLDKADGGLFEITDPYDDNVFLLEDLGFQDMSPFIALAHFRYALPSRFYESWCKHQGPIMIESGWAIQIDPIECRLWEENLYRQIGYRDSPDTSDPACSDEDACFPMPPTFGDYEGENEEAFRESEFVNDLTCGAQLFDKEAEQAICEWSYQECGVDGCSTFLDFAYSYLPTDDRSWSDLFEEKGLSCMLDHFTQDSSGEEAYDQDCCSIAEIVSEALDRDWTEEVIDLQLAESCRPASEATPVELRNREMVSEVQRFLYQVVRNKPARIALALQHQDGLSKDASSVPILVSNHGMIWDLGCRYYPMEFGIDSDTFAKPDTKEAEWDCQTHIKLANYLTAQLDITVNEREGVDYKRGDSPRDYEFYKGYMKVLESEYEKDVKVPLIDIEVSSRWLLYVIYSLIVALMIWLLSVQQSMLRIGPLRPTVPWVNTMLPSLRAQLGLFQKVIILLSVAPVLLARLSFYLLPSLALLALLTIQDQQNTLGTRQINSVDLMFSVAMIVLCFLLSLVSIYYEYKLLKRAYNEQSPNDLR